MTKVPTILAIESSCDESAAALWGNHRLLSNIIISQEFHKKHGGVIPEIASRLHERHLPWVVDKALVQADCPLADIDAVAFTQGPGLMGSLLVGAALAKAFAWSRDIPLIGIDHLSAHCHSLFIAKPFPSFPFLCLLVSGGHTRLSLMRARDEATLIGETQDDAVGEAFDKAARLLGLPYPGGPAIEAHAKNGNPHAFVFPKVNMPDFQYSFSGLKTAFMYFIEENKKKNAHFVSENQADLCASIEHALVEALLIPLTAAVRAYDVRDIAVVGGVAANTTLRKRLDAQKNWRVHVPAMEYCTDNAAMVACAAAYAYAKGRFTSMEATPYARAKV